MIQPTENEAWQGTTVVECLRMALFLCREFWFESCFLKVIRMSERIVGETDTNMVIIGSDFLIEKISTHSMVVIGVEACIINDLGSLKSHWLPPPLGVEGDVLHGDD